MNMNKSDLPRILTSTRSNSCFYNEMLTQFTVVCDKSKTNLEQESHVCSLA